MRLERARGSIGDKDHRKDHDQAAKTAVPHSRSQTRARTRVTSSEGWIDGVTEPPAFRIPSSHTCCGGSKSCLWRLLELLDPWFGSVPPPHCVSPLTTGRASRSARFAVAFARRLSSAGIANADADASKKVFPMCPSRTAHTTSQCGFSPSA